MSKKEICCNCPMGYDTEELLCENKECHQCTICKNCYRYHIYNAASFEVRSIDQMTHNFTMSEDGYPIYPVYPNNEKKETIVIITGYDSNSFDGTFFRFISDDADKPYMKKELIINKFPWVKEVIGKGVCDDCIKSLLNNKTIEIYYGQ